MRFEMLMRGTDRVERVERTSGHSLEEQDLARTAQGETRHREQLADLGDDRDPYRVTAWHAVDVGDRQRALWPVGRRASAVALEDLGERALAARDDDELVIVGKLLETLQTRVADADGTVERFEFAKPARQLEPLVDGLSRGPQRCGELESLGPVDAGDGDLSAWI